MRALPLVLTRSCAAVVVLVTIAACSSSRPGGSEPTATPPPSSQATASPSPAPTTPAPTAAPTSDWLISGAGIGRIVLGGPVAGLEDLPLDDQFESCTTRFATIDTWTVAIVGTPTQTVGSVFVYGWDPSLGGADLPRTAGGIGLGSDRSAVEAAFPGVTAVFETNGDGIVVALGVGWDAIPYEFCN